MSLIGDLPDGLGEDGFPHGEQVHISERIVVAPAWGRFHPAVVSSGQTLDHGDVIGVLREGGDVTPLVAHARSIFIRWFAEEGERVPPGRRLASLRLIDGGTAPSL